MPEPLYVDPERLSAYGRPYEAASLEWRRLHTTIAGIRSRYQGVWGDDDLGNQFGPSFLEGMDSVAQRVLIVGDTLSYYGQGLHDSGKIFGDARDGADTTTHLFLADSEIIGGHDAPPWTGGYNTALWTGEHIEGESTPVTALRRAQSFVFSERSPGGLHQLSLRMQKKVATPFHTLLAQRLPAEGIEYATLPLAPRLPLRPTKVHQLYRSVHPADDPDQPGDPIPLRPTESYQFYRLEKPADDPDQPEEPIPLRPTESYQFYRSIKPANAPPYPEGTSEEPE